MSLTSFDCSGLDRIFFGIVVMEPKSTEDMMFSWKYHFTFFSLSSVDFCIDLFRHVSFTAAKPFFFSGQEKITFREKHKEFWEISDGFILYLEANV